MAEKKKPGVDYVGVGCGGLLFNERGEVLLGLRRNAHGAGLWEKPGGRVEYGEKVEETVRREFREETGLDVEIVRLVNVMDWITEGQHWVTLNYIVRRKDGKLVNREPHKNERLEWFSLGALPENVAEPMRSMAEALRREKHEGLRAP